MQQLHQFGVEKRVVFPLVWGQFFFIQGNWAEFQIAGYSNRGEGKNKGLVELLVAQELKFLEIV